MALKIWNIVKANTRIEELETQLAAKETELSALAGNPSELEAAAQTQLAELSQARADLTTAKQTIGTLETAAKAHAAQVAKLTSDLAAAEAKLATVPAQVETAAAAKSVQIAASQGIPPLEIKPVASPGAATKSQAKGKTAIERLREEQQARNPLNLTQ